MFYMRRRFKNGHTYGNIMTDDYDTEPHGYRNHLRLSSSDTDKMSSQTKSSLWVRLRKRLKRRGVVEIDIDHHRYKMLNCIRDGIRNVTLKHPELGPKEKLSQEDYSHELVVSCETKKGKDSGLAVKPHGTQPECDILINGTKTKKKTFTFCSYASAVFATIRRAVNVSEEEYLNAVAPPSLPYLEFISNSKSGQDFFLSNDQQYILKTDKEYSVHYFLSFLGEYLEHFQLYPHSLIVKFLGLYSIEIQGEPKIYFLSMQSIFYPPERIETRFDVKGCLGGRYQKPQAPGSQVLTILKDKNFENETIHLGAEREWFIRQLKIDVEFFRELGVQDYSLLVGRHRRRQEEKAENSFPVVVRRVQKSFGRPSRSRVSPVCTVKQVGASSWEMELRPRSPENHGTTKSEDPSGEIDETSLSNHKIVSLRNSENSPSNGGTQMFTFKNLLQLAKEVDKYQPSNLRLLPDCRNPLHVIDGDEYRYYLGIIDFFTQYECWQRGARVLKTMKNCTTDHSTAPPDVYADRFLKFIVNRTE